jgi:hypothetical protein
MLSGLERSLDLECSLDFVNICSPLLRIVPRIQSLQQDCTNMFCLPSTPITILEPPIGYWTSKLATTIREPFSLPGRLSQVNVPRSCRSEPFLRLSRSPRTLIVWKSTSHFTRITSKFQNVHKPSSINQKKRALGSFLSPTRAYNIEVVIQSWVRPIPSSKHRPDSTCTRRCP